MKKQIFIVLGILLLSRISSAQDVAYERYETGQQHYEISGLSTTQAIIAFSDTMRLLFPYTGISWIKLDSDAQKLSYYFHSSSKMEAIIPVSWNEDIARSILTVIDSLAKTGIHNNLRIVNRISCNMACHLGNGEADWQKEIALKAAIFDLDYSARATNSSPALCCLPKALYTEYIINRVRDIFHSPFLTRKEAEIMAQSSYLQTPRDTTGYDELREKYRKNTATADEEKRYNNLYWWLKDLQNRGQTIEQYTDSVNRRTYEGTVNQWDGKLWWGCSEIIYHAADKRINALAPLIDSFATPEIRQKLEKMNSINFDNIFARLNYKNFKQQQKEKYIHLMDSCITYLKDHPELNPYDVTLMKSTIETCYSYAVSFGGIPDILLYKMAPLLLLKNKMKSPDVSVGTYFYRWHFLNIIENMPRIPDGVLIDDLDKKDFPAKIYQWMMENKDKYQLRSFPSDDD